MNVPAILFLRNLVFSGIHGCTPAEQVAPQPFKVDVDITVDVSGAGVSDKLEDTYDYVLARDIVRTVIENESYSLIETVASEIIRRVRLDPKVASVTVELTKLHFSQNGVSGIRLSDKA